MSDSNPFAKLQNIFSNTTRQESSAPNPAKGETRAKETKGKNSHVPAGCGGKTGKTGRTDQQGNEDSLLFLQTVNALPVANGKTPRGQEDTLFKQAMQEAGIIPMGQKHPKKNSAPAGKNAGSSALMSSSDTGQPEVPQPDDKRTDSQQPPAAISETAPTPATGGQKELTPSKTSHKRLSSQRSRSPQGSGPGMKMPDAKQAVLPPGAASHDTALFASAMNNVVPLNKRGRDITAPTEKPLPHPSGKTPAQIMQEIIDGRIEFAIQHTGEYMEGFVQGVSPEVLDKLRLGQFSPEAHTDLHGLNAEQAYAELVRFIKSCYQRNIRTVTVITGRGINSPDGVAVIRSLMQEWLTHDPFKRVVLAFCSARPCDGGAGALYVLLRKYKKSLGKIQWELPYKNPEDIL